MDSDNLMYKLLIDDTFWMRRALLLAKNALYLNKVPVASVIVCDNFEIGIGFNFSNYNFASLSHAEINCLNQACFYTSNYVLPECTLYVTLEPCFVCLSVIFSSRIKRVVFGAYYKKHKCHTFVKSDYYNTAFYLRGGLLEDEAKILLYKFFNFVR